MSDDREVLREVWQGRIPTAFTLASEDVTSISPQTFYLMLPRLSYFALATDKVSFFKMKISYKLNKKICKIVIIFLLQFFFR